MLLTPGNTQPFTERRVEDALVPWLERNGYAVKKKVRAVNGIIDLVATGPDGRWVIEAKGEDKGGYTSAEMNFHVGIGQIVSRMAESSQHFALAIPLTSDFSRVLKKFRGTPGFERLGVGLFVVDENRAVRRVDPADVLRYLDSLE